MKSKFVRRLLAAGLTLALCLGLMATNVFAAGTVNEVKEKTGSNGSIVVTVYDNDPDTSSDSGTGGTTQVEDAVGVKDVSINALRIGSVVELTSTENSTVSTQVAFGLTQDYCNLLGLQTNTAIASKDVSGTITYYFAPTAVQDALKTANENTGNSNPTQASIEQYVNSQQENAKKTAVTDDSGAATFNGLQYGLYLLAKSSLPSNATTDLVPFLVSVPMYVEDEGTWNSTVYAYPKVRAAEIELTKTAAAPADDSYVKSGETIPFTVTATIPAAETGNSAATKFTSFVITDTNANNTLDITQSTVEVKLSSESDPLQFETDYSLAYPGDGTNSVLTITLESAGLAKINDGLGNAQTLTVTYKATVATDVTFSSELTNTANLSYQREGMKEPDTTKNSTVNLYTYGIDLTKTLSESGVNINANTIKFELYKNYEPSTGALNNKIPVVQGTGSSNGYWQAATGSSTSGEMIVTGGSTNGKLNLYGLEPGTYYLKETATMPGYALLEKPITIVITAPETLGKEPTATVNGANAQVNDGVVSLAVENTKLTAGFKLPQTGGAGTLAVTAIGLGLLCVGIILLVVYRKKGSKNS